MSWLFYRAIRQTSHALGVRSRKLFKEYGLTLPQLDVLWAVSQSDDAPAHQIAAQVNLRTATVTSIADRLVEHGLITRFRSTEDKRRVILRLTERGSEILDSDPEPFGESFMSRLRELPAWRQSELLSAVQHVASMVEEVESDLTMTHPASG